MAGLNNTLSDTQQTTTTMPAWYDQAQQNIVSGGNTAAAAAPTFGQTTQQNAVNTLQGAANPFTQAQGTLQQISSGAANPWITDQATGTVTPNTSTAMGGLFQAQQQELNQLMPNYSAPAQAGAIGSGNFGSLRGQTAVDKARGDAFAKLNAAQMQAALSNQQTGTQAATGLGNVGQQGINANMNVGAQQMNAPFQTIGNQASLLGTLQAPTTVSSQKQLSPLGQIASVGNAITGGTAGLNSLLTQLGIKGGLSGLFTGSGSGITLGANGQPTAGTYPLAGGGSMVINPDGSKVITNADGTVSNFGANTNPTADPLSPIPDTGLPTTPDTGTPDNSGAIPDYTGPAIDYNPTNDAGSANFADPGYSEY
jgi:hypothetical protein